MSKKHVDEYFSQICSQYHEMIQDIKDLEEEASTGMVDPDRIENMKKIIEPIMANYERWSYMMFLLNQPNKKDKKKKYQKQNASMLKNFKAENSLDGVLQENNDTLEKLKKN